VIEVDLLLEDDVDGASEFLLYEGTSDGGVLLTGFPLVEAFDLREVLNGTYGCMTQRELEMAVAVLTTTVPALAS
jgi:hypothetical protein